MGIKYINERRYYAPILLILFLLGPVSIFSTISKYNYQLENYGSNYDADVENLESLMLESLIPLVYTDGINDMTFSISGNNLVIMGLEDINSSAFNTDSKYIAHKIQFDENFVSILEVSRIDLEIPLNSYKSEFKGFYFYNNHYYTLQTYTSYGKFSRNLLEFNANGIISGNISVPLSISESEYSENLYAEFQMVLSENAFYLSEYYYEAFYQTTDCFFKKYQIENSKLEFKEIKYTPIDSCTYGLTAGMDGNLWQIFTFEPISSPSAYSSNNQTVGRSYFGFKTGDNSKMVTMASIFFHHFHHAYLPETEIIGEIDSSSLDGYNPTHTLRTGDGIIIQRYGGLAVLSPIKITYRFVIDGEYGIRSISYLAGFRIVPAVANNEYCVDLLFKSSSTLAFLVVSVLVLNHDMRRKNKISVH